MKKLLQITLAMLFSHAALGQIQIKEINESLAKINDTLFASKYETSNKQYKTFLNSLEKSKNTSLLTIAQIDTLKWKDTLTYNEPYAQYYHSHNAYQNYPVVNISYEASKLFCEWLTEQYNSNPKRKFQKVLFRLPSEKEWITAAQAGDISAIYPWKGKELHNKTNQVMCNYKQELQPPLVLNQKNIENTDITAPTKSYWKNNFGMYNMSGNVAEMIDEKGVLKGGSWKEDAEYLKIRTRNKYNGEAQTFVGFRYFAEILEK